MAGRDQQKDPEQSLRAVIQRVLAMSNNQDGGKESVTLKDQPLN